jgi:hypothetical protein
LQIVELGTEFVGAVRSQYEEVKRSHVEKTRIFAGAILGDQDSRREWFGAHVDYFGCGHVARKLVVDVGWAVLNSLQVRLAVPGPISSLQKQARNSELGVFPVHEQLGAVAAVPSARSPISVGPARESVVVVSVYVSAASTWAPTAVVDRGVMRYAATAERAQDGENGQDEVTLRE